MMSECLEIYLDLLNMSTVFELFCENLMIVMKLDRMN